MSKPIVDSAMKTFWYGDKKKQQKATPKKEETQLPSELLRLLNQGGITIEDLYKMKHGQLGKNTYERALTQTQQQGNPAYNAIDWIKQLYKY